MGGHVSVQLKEELLDHQNYQKVDRKPLDIMICLGPGGTQVKTE